MKILRNFATIILVLMTSFSIALVPISSAQPGETITVALQLAVNPNPTGVDQTIDVIIWGQPIPPGAGEVFHNFTVTITKNGETTQTLGPVDSWPVGAYAFRYTPTEIGEYTFLLDYPGEYFASEDQTYLPGQSQLVTLTVQQDPISGMPTTPLPEYIDGIVNTENREWSGIVGSWMMTYYDSTYTGYGDSGGGYNPFTTAPRSPHIRWAIPATTGGLPGGEVGTAGVYSGLSYSSFGNPPIIMHNKLFVNTYGNLGHFREGGDGFACYDLQTGEKLWSNDEGGITHGQHYRSPAPANPGIHSFLWDLDASNNQWEVYDPFDGSLQMTFENITKQGTQWWWEDAVVYGPDGDIYVYILDGYANELTMWNSTKAFWGNGIIRYGGDGIPRFGWSSSRIYDWEKGIEWTVTIPDRNVGWHTPYSIFGISDGVAIGKTGTAGNWIDWEMGYDLDTGTEIWVHDKSESVQSFYNSVGEGVTAAFDLTTRTWTAFNIKTGAYLWETPPADYPWGTYGSYGSTIANGQLLHGNFDGHLYAYDLETGEVNWKFYSGDSGIETVMGHWPMWQGPLVADGVVFTGTGEETPTQPLTRGNRVFAIDEEKGDEIWHIAGYMSLKAVAEGVLIGYNGYDSQIYCFGKGPSAMTVEVPLTAVPKGTAVMITGTITDQSAGAMGTPCISDEDMGAWMEYLYMQKPPPMDVTGVPVKLAYMLPDGSWKDIDETTSDSNGNFGYLWTPPDEGSYLVTAFFLGSESYGSSSATTYLAVGPEPAPEAPTKGEVAEEVVDQLPAYTTIDLAIIAAVVVAIVIGIVNLWALRKR
ncbi:MAG: PQQ-binding-like beta-propeller repeat protein [Candidatus Bathyarchaeota archaeon]|nr:PQQ-binding-like beta-propeller repeat protein [Candidatus Bathyarchaeota archaeon]